MSISDDMCGNVESTLKPKVWSSLYVSIYFVEKGQIKGVRVSSVVYTNATQSKFVTSSVHAFGSSTVLLSELRCNYIRPPQSSYPNKSYDGQKIGLSG